ncbi:MAG: T9SS type A sorting domain-containing protein [Chitinophagales bacterium]|nr:T9SS type A sorting domain-containing protein [Chitinophagales bacterium]
MNLLRLTFLVLLCAFAETLSAQVTVTGANPLSNGSYTNLSGAGGAFFYINSYSQSTYDVVITITGNVTEPNSANVQLTAGSWNTLTIKPSGGSWTISGAPAANGMIILDGADKVTIDGSISGTVSLTIANTSASSTAMAIVLKNDATNNVIKYCNLQGRNSAAQTASDGGIVTIAGTAGSTGNDNNYIQNCDFGPDASTLPYILIKGYGSGNANDLCQVTNCTFHDWLDFTAGNNTCAIYLAATFISTWTISGNRFYQSATRNISAGSANDFYGVKIDGGGGYTISNNIFGYSSAAGTGYMTFTDLAAGSHTSIDLYPFCLSLNTTLSTISGNTITNIDFTTARSTNSGTTYPFIGIWLKSGKANITNNTIGTASGTGSILFKQNIETASPSLPYLPVAGILMSGSSSNTISGNTIGGISMSYTGSGAIGTYGGNPLIGIYSNNTGASTISSNIIGNATAYNITSGNTASGANVIGIKLASNAALTNTVSTNTIQNLNCSGANAGTTSNASVIGIVNTSCSSVSDIISGNIISYLTNTSSSGNTDVRGLYVTGGSGGLAPSLAVAQNWIHSLSVSSTSSTAQVSGITIYTGGNSAILSNNMISLGSGMSNGNVIYGINYSSSTVTGYFNTVRIQGSPASGSGNTHAFYCATTNALILKNNIFINERSNTGTSTGTHYAIRFNSTPFSYTGVANDLYATGTGSMLGYVGAANKATLALWSAATTPVNQDNPSGTPPSISTNFTFASTIDLHIAATACDLATINNAGTPIVGYTTDYDATSRSGSTPDIGADEVSNLLTWTGATSTDWNVATNWNPQNVPTIYYDVTIPVVTTNYPIISGTTATCHSLTISATASLTMNSGGKLTLDATCSNATFTNAGTFTANANTEVIFTKTLNSYTASIVPTAATQFENVTLNIGVGMGGSSTTVNGILQIKSGGYVISSSAPTYSINSTLQYNTNGSYTANAEWYDNTFSGAGWPQHVDIAGTGTKLVFGTGYPRELRGNLTIGSGDTLSLSAISGGDLYIKGNWTRAATGVFIPAGRMVKFNGSANQTVTVTGGGTESFAYVAIDKSTAGTYVQPDKTVANATDIKITGTSGNVLQLINNGSLDLNGRTVSLDGNSAIGATGFIYVNGNRVITNSQGVNTGKFEIRSTANPNMISWFTKSVANNGGVGSLTFDQHVLVTIADGQMDFGISSGINLTTIQGVLQINLGGSVVYNSCYYSASPASTLRFANNIDYQVYTTDLTWAAGSIFSGLPGIPYNVEINGIGTLLTINDTRGVRNNITITDGGLLLAAGTGDFYVGGNWSRSGVNSSFTDNNNYVEFGGNADQSISCTANGNKETFYGLTINNTDATPQVSLVSATSIQIIESFRLYAGIVACGTGEVYVSNASEGAIIYDASDNAADSWVNGPLRRAITTGNYAFPVGGSNLAGGSGYELAFLDMKTNSNIDNIVGKFTSDISTAGNESYSLVVNGTLILDRLNAGYWNFKPYDAAFAPVASPACDYNVALNERGHSNSAASPYYYAVIKRVDSADPSAAVWNQQCGTHDNSTQTESGGTAHAERTDYGCNTFSDFAIGVGEFILPLELTQFTVSLEEGNSLLEWHTQAEFNTSYFAIERSLDGVHFEEIARKDAAGVSVVPLNYLTTDYKVQELGVHKIYYRLRMVDLDASFSYSSVRWIELQDAASESVMTVFPNPVVDHITISVEVPENQAALLQVIDVSGKVILEMPYALTGGLNFIEVGDLHTLVPGLYLVRIASGRNYFSAKMIKN